MSWRRKAVYLILIAPLHHILSLIATVPATLLLPPDIFAQLLLTIPLFAVAVWTVVPAFQRSMGLQISPHRIVAHRIATLLGSLLPLGLIIVAVFSGFATPVEALVLGALILYRHPCVAYPRLLNAPCYPFQTVAFSRHSGPSAPFHKI